MKGFNDFVAIDFETANGNRSSICSVGLVIIRNGEIVDKYYSLVNPHRTIMRGSAKKCMDWAMKILIMPLSFQKYGQR